MAIGGRAGKGFLFKRKKRKREVKNPKKEKNGRKRAILKEKGIKEEERRRGKIRSPPPKIKKFFLFKLKEERGEKKFLPLKGKINPKIVLSFITSWANLTICFVR